VDNRGVEPVLWLLTPFLVTAAVAAVLFVRRRRLTPERTEELRKQQLRRIERALRPEADRAGGRR
jgi:cytochrome c-type biogenesis protein CcmH/NrfF